VEGCAEGPQTSTLWYTRSHDENAERWFALGVAELRRDELDVVVQGRRRGTPARRCSRACDELETGPADTARVSDETRLRPQHRRAAGRSGGRAGLPARRATGVVQNA